MVDVLVTSLNAIVPIVLLILLGYLLKRFKFLNDNFIKVGNKFVFRVCLPCMLFLNIYDKMKFSDIPWEIVIYVVIAILVIFGLGFLTAILTTKKKGRRGVIVQCAFRSNFAIIGLALVGSLGGDEALAGIVSAFTIPIFNILAVIALSIFAEEETLVEETANEQLTLDSAVAEGVWHVSEEKAIKSKHSIKNVLLNIVKNPLIIGVFAGLIAVGIREIEIACCGEVVFSFQNHLTFMYKGVDYIRIIASPLALVVLGGQFKFTAVKGMTKEIVVGTVWRVFLAPLIGVGVAILLRTYTDLFTFELSEVYPTLVALFGTPVAVTSAIMAGEMKNDEQLAAQLVVWTSLCSIVTIFAMVVLIGLII